MAMEPKFTKEVNQTAELFRKLWPCVTDDHNLTLHGFRRFKTTHLLNLRFLEQDIAEVDRKIYQAGLSLGCEPASGDRLGLRNGTHDYNVPVLEDTITKDLVLKLRDLLQKYDEALMAFSSIMAMETVSLLDDGKQSSLQTDLTMYEKYNTRLIRADIGARSRIDPFQRWLHKRLRAFRYWRIVNKQDDPESSTASTQGYWVRQNTVLIANIVGRVTAAIMASSFLVAPLAILSPQPIEASQLALVCIFVVLFATVITAMWRVSSYEMMAVSAAYAAVLSVFMSGGS
ncbi:hypothetical protein S40288_11334 [Stachybotrys chartarum IBT 40288]|nr:hypothetical protein S40288_11334 [Stachybotrys chartarum IBT 40288]